MTSRDFASSSEHLLVRRSADVEIDPGTNGSAKPRVASDGRGDPTGVARLVVGTELMSDTTVVSFAGEIDLITMEQFEGALRSHLNDGATIVVIDLAEVSFVSVGGGRVLLTAIRQARRRGLDVRVSLSPAARRIVSLFSATAECEAGAGGAR